MIELNNKSKRIYNCRRRIYCSLIQLNHTRYEYDIDFINNKF